MKGRMKDFVMMRNVSINPKNSVDMNCMIEKNKRALEDLRGRMIDMQKKKDITYKKKEGKKERQVQHMRNIFCDGSRLCEISM